MVHCVLKFRFLIIAIIAVLTFFIAQHSVNVQLSVDRAKILPSSHKEYIDNENFQKKYGENHVIAIAISDPEFYSVERFNFWNSICNKIDSIDDHSFIELNKSDEKEYISAQKKININQLKEKIFKHVRKIHVKRFPYNKFLYPDID